ncbi:MULTISPECIES: TIR domain-containing protein [Cytobacillus]|uniref:TIR domain-containing protein n=1 Tax=Cytobacillus stercorigallinarum TaxID=2762240 RepID=A0ABR8QVZ2_9BACI|nr:TIR domain-containing protein [Cytobacillus stercorigallinarum]MBD7939681.1 TIR domain-containing protein [Cytobacillus stercorigallinarum]
MHKTFISYHHKNEQDLKNEIIEKFGGEDFIDSSVADGEINTDLSEDGIMRIIREDYLHNSTVTVVLLGWETAQRPYVNSEIQASLRDTSKNKHNGLLAVIRDDLYNTIFTSDTCSDCGGIVRNRNKAFYEYYIPNLIKKNHAYNGDKCHYTSKDVYCAVVKYSDFISTPEFYIDEAFDKRDNDLLAIKKIPDECTPRIGMNTAKSLI